MTTPDPRAHRSDAVDMKADADALAWLRAELTKARAELERVTAERDRLATTLALDLSDRLLAVSLGSPTPAQEPDAAANSVSVSGPVAWTSPLVPLGEQLRGGSLAVTPSSAPAPAPAVGDRPDGAQETTQAARARIAVDALTEEGQQ